MEYQLRQQEEKGFHSESQEDVSIAALASLAACGGVKDSGSASGDADVITVGTTDKVTSVDPAGSYDNGSYAVQINVFPFLYAQDYNTSELSPDIAADDGTWSDDGTEFTVKIKSGLKFANGHDLTSSDVKFSFDRVNTINDENGPKRSSPPTSSLMLTPSSRRRLSPVRTF